MRQTIIDRIREAGVVGAGGAGLPAHVKADAAADTVLVNGASCEPLLMSDPHLLAEECAVVLRGLAALMECVGAQKGLICLKAKHKTALAAVKKALATEGDSRLSVFELDDFYPAGDEQVLVREVLGRTVPERGLPLQVGAVVSNVETLYNVALAQKGLPVTHRWLTVAGAVRRPAVLRVPVGSPVSEVLDFLGGAAIADFRVVDGGPMMGRVLPDTDRPVTKTTGGLLVLPPDHTVIRPKVMDPERLRRITGSVCCQCSLCTDLCPRNLLGHGLRPHKLMRLDPGCWTDSPLAREALLCSECGVCEKFACPMQVSPREVNAQIKKALGAAGVAWQATGRPLVENGFRKIRAVPTKRLLLRLDLAAYDREPVVVEGFAPSRLLLPLKQHLGLAAEALVQAGDRLRPGDLVADIPEKGMAARVHCGLGGVVTDVSDGMIRIRVEQAGQGGRT